LHGLHKDLRLGSSHGLKVPEGHTDLVGGIQIEPKGSGVGLVEDMRTIYFHGHRTREAIPGLKGLLGGLCKGMGGKGKTVACQKIQSFAHKKMLSVLGALDDILGLFSLNAVKGDCVDSRVWSVLPHIGEFQGAHGILGCPEDWHLQAFS